MPGAILVAMLALAAAPPSPNVDARIAAAAAAAQALQGPLDGTWILADGHGRTIYVLQIVDPPNRGDALQAAWRDPSGLIGVAGAVRRRGDHLDMKFDGSGDRLRLRRDTDRAWRGQLEREGPRLAVTLRRAGAGFR